MRCLTRCGRRAFRASRCRPRRAGYGRPSRRRIAAPPRKRETRAMNLREAWRLARRAVEAWTEDYAPSMGAALSYYALFSIAPLLLIVIGVAGYFFGEEAARGEIYGQLAALTGSDGAHAVQGLVAAARKPQKRPARRAHRHSVAHCRSLDRLRRAAQRARSHLGRAGETEGQRLVGAAAHARALFRHDLRGLALHR